MIVMLHVLIALTSIAVVTFTYIAPSTLKLCVAYVLEALTLTTGLYLVVSEPAQMLRSCTMGVLYLAVVTVGTVAVRRKLAAMRNTV